MQHVDTVVIGGGIVGNSTAFFMAMQGAAKVALFERATIASEASGRTGALLRRHYTNEPEARLATRGYEIYRDWETFTGEPSAHTPHPVVVTVDTAGESEGNIEKIRRNVAMLNGLGIEIEMVTQADLQRLQPFADWSDIDVATLEPQSGYVDAVQATRSMARAAERAGVIVHDHQPVLEILVTGGRVTGVRTASGDIACDTVVCAAGPWSNGLLTPHGIDVPVTALRVQVAILHRPLILQEDHFVYLDVAAGVFTRPWGDGRSLVGVGGGDQHDEVDPDGYDPRNDLGYADLAIEAIAKRIPDMRHAAYLHGHAGLYDMSPDTHPIIGETGIAGLYLAAGFSGAGFKKGPAVGEALAKMISGQSPEETGLAPFALGRFETESWREPWSETEYIFSSDFGHRL